MLAHSAYTSDPRIRREAEALVGQGCEVHVIALSEKRNGVREARKGSLNGVHIHRLPVSQRRGGFLRYVYEYSMVGFLGALKLAWLHSRRALDVVHVHNMPDILIMAGLLPRLLGSKLVLDVHDPAPELYMSWGHGPRDMVVRLLATSGKIQLLACGHSHLRERHDEGQPPEQRRPRRQDFHRAQLSRPGIFPAC